MATRTRLTVDPFSEPVVEPGTHCRGKLAA
jgi:hypothetical protein